jgi:hypothetical protein
VKKKNTITTNTGYKLRFFFISVASYDQDNVRKVYNRKCGESIGLRYKLAMTILFEFSTKIMQSDFFPILKHEEFEINGVIHNMYLIDLDKCQ